MKRRIIFVNGKNWCKGWVEGGALGSKMDSDVAMVVWANGEEGAGDTSVHLHESLTASAASVAPMQTKWSTAPPLHVARRR